MIRVCQPDQKHQFLCDKHGGFDTLSDIIQY